MGLFCRYLSQSYMGKINEQCLKVNKETNYDLALALKNLPFLHSKKAKIGEYYDMIVLEN